MLTAALQILLEEIEAQAAQLGLRSTRRLPIDASQVLGTGMAMATRAAAFFDLPGASMHYLVVLVTEVDVRCSLLALALKVTR